MERIKAQMAAYWSRRVEAFAGLRYREFKSEKHEQWLAELDRWLPKGGRLNILDVGTGTGFFAFLLAERGHHVTGIDLTPEMIAEARRLASGLHLPPEFYVMDAENPGLPAHSFDVVVTRKLTWTLPHLPQAYARWHELLKPDGLLINFDADYCREKEPGQLPAHHAHQDVSHELMQQYGRLKQSLRQTQQPRPQWDVQLLSRAGFHDIQVDTGVWQRLYRKIDEFYDPIPGFALVATA